MTRTTERPRRPWATRLAVAATTLAVAGGGAFAMNAWLSDDPAPFVAAPTRTTLGGAGDTGMMSCAMLEPGMLSEVSVAFSGTVTEVGADVATLEVDHWYAGPGTDLVDVNQSDEDTLSEAGVHFDQGTRYLVTAYTDPANGESRVSGCWTFTWDAETAAVFDEAFGG
jgi:hypothetical protein